MQKIFRRAVKAGAFILVLGTMCTSFSWHWMGKRNGHSRVKRNYFGGELSGLTRLSDEPSDYENPEWLESAMKESIPGQLVCLHSNVKPLPKPILARRAGPAFIDSEETPLRLEDRMKVSITHLSSKRPIGCCPAGDPSGTMYRPGWACCNDTIFDVSKQFCCTMRSRNQLLSLTEEDLNYCHPPDGIPYCRVKDLLMKENGAMMYRCKNNSKGRPESCDYTCPQGSKPAKRITTSRCLRDGVWDVKPICCEGCRNDFRLDLWFFIQVPENKNSKRIENLKTFLKEFLKYLPVSQQKVRVGFDLVTNEGNARESVWNLNRINSYSDAREAIEALSFKGVGSKIGVSLRELGENGFMASAGDRKDVNNLVVAIILDPSEDSVLEGANILKEKSDVIAVAVGTDVTDEDLFVLASEAGDVIRVKDSEELKNFATHLHSHICGSNCI